MTNKKHLTQLLFFIVVIIYTAKFIWNETRPDHNSSSLLEHVALQDITAKKFDTNGHISYLITGKSITQQDNLARYNITAVKLLKHDQQPTWQLTAASAVWDQLSHDITLTDKVQLSLPPNYTATTDLLKISLKDNTASTPNTVKFYNNSSIITARGMELDLATANVKLNHDIAGKAQPK